MIALAICLIVALGLVIWLYGLNKIRTGKGGLESAKGALIAMVGGTLLSGGLVLGLLIFVS